MFDSAVRGSLYLFVNLTFVNTGFGAVYVIRIWWLLFVRQLSPMVFCRGRKNVRGSAGQDSEAKKYYPKFDGGWRHFCPDPKGSALPAERVYLCLGKKARGVSGSAYYLFWLGFIFIRMDGRNAMEAIDPSTKISFRSELPLPLWSGTWHPKGIGFFEARNVTDGFDRKRLIKCICI